ncbi:MAG: hypothetical protein ACLTT1_01710 [[Clostridium] scindens]
MAKNEKEQITAGTVTARRVEIRITKSVNNGGSKVNACLIRAIFHGNVDGVEYTSGQGGTTNGTSYTLDDGMTRKGAVPSGPGLVRDALSLISEEKIRRKAAERIGGSCTLRIRAYSA